MGETDAMNRAMVALSDADVTIFRQNVAQGVVGDVFWPKTQQALTVRPGDAVVRHARVLHAGLKEGSADLIGLTPIEITAALVGRTLPVFTSIEMKHATDLRTEQKTWLRFMLSQGAIAGVARSPAEAVEIVEAYRRGAK